MFSCSELSGGRCTTSPKLVAIRWATEQIKALVSAVAGTFLLGGKSNCGPFFYRIVDLFP